MKQRHILDNPRSAKADPSCVTTDYSITGHDVGLVTSSLGGVCCGEGVPGSISLGRATGIATWSNSF
jgi:hypothetical protein